MSQSVTKIYLTPNTKRTPAEKLRPQQAPWLCGRTLDCTLLASFSGCACHYLQVGMRNYLVTCLKKINSNHNNPLFLAVSQAFQAESHIKNFAYSLSSAWNVLSTDLAVPLLPCGFQFLWKHNQVSESDLDSMHVDSAVLLYSSSSFPAHTCSIGRIIPWSAV